MPARADRRAILAALVVTLAGCGAPRGGPQMAPPLAMLHEVPPIESTVILVGDAGGVLARGSPVMDALSREVAEAPARTHVLFLGDNVYPQGLPAPGAPGHDAAASRLETQLHAARDARTTTFLPGNHDWTGRGDTARHGIERQAMRVTLGGRASWAPFPGCPGPSVRDVGAHLRLLFLDSEWWLRERTPSEGLQERCAERTPDDVVAAITSAVRGAGGRSVVIAVHHPPISAGPHGGHFSWRDHLFPLLNVRTFLWVPLPVVGSLYPLARRLGMSPQDQSHPRYRAMVTALRTALAGSGVSLVVAGHEHQLAVLSGDVVGVPYVVVSGAGTDRNATYAARSPQVRFVAAASGFMRLDVRTDGTLWLQAVVIDARGALTRPFRQQLDERHVPH